MPRPFACEYRLMAIPSPVRLLKIAMHAMRMLAGYGIFLVTRTTPDFAFRSMGSLFCHSGGRSNDVFSWFIGKTRPPHAALSKARAPLHDEHDRAIAALREQGYYAFGKPLPTDVCERLLHFAQTQPCVMRPMEDGSLSAPVKTVYARGAPRAVRYDFETQDLLANGDVQDIVADLSLVAIAQDYLGARPLLDVVSMWWHTDFLDHPDSNAAQFFHFDMDRPKWIKVFIFLTDVTATSGPHTFVAGSHRTGAIPQALLDKGQVRLSDDDVGRAYAPEKIIEFRVPRGTVMLEDTRGLHKGKHVESGDRLVLQFQFSNSLFGMAYPDSRFGDRTSGLLLDSMARFPDVYEAYR